jgi:hypothetical protein
MKHRNISRTITFLTIAVVLSFLGARVATAGLVWQSLAPFNDPRTTGGIEGAAASLIGGKIYVSEGFRSGDSNFLSIYDIATDTWTHGGAGAPDTPGPARSEGAGGTAGGNHYTIGGRTGVTPNGDTVHEFTPGGAWVTKDAMPTPRRGLGTGSLAGKIYAVGGSDGGSPGAGTPTSAFEVFDPTLAAGSQWTSLTPLPAALMDVEATIALDAATSGTTGGALIVFGGRPGGGGFVSSTWVYDIAANSWSAGAPMPTARANAMAGLIMQGSPLDGMIAVFGGNNNLNLTVTELYDPLTDTWMAGPNMLLPTSEQAVGMLWDSTGIYSIGEGIFGASGSGVERLVWVPEPGTLMLLALGLAGLGLGRRGRANT